MNRLKNVDTHEVSLVLRGANRKEFIKKTGDETMTPEMIAKILGMSKLDKAKVDAVIKAMNLSPEAQAAIEGAVRMLEAVKDQLPAEVLTHISALSGIAIPEQKAASPAEGDKKDDLLKSLDKLPAEVRAIIIKEREDDRARIAKMESELAKQRDDEIGRQAIAKAEALVSLPGDKAVVAAILKQATKIDPNLAISIEQILTAANAVIKTSKAFSETGSGGAGASGSTMERVNKMADEMVQKSTKGLTREQAVTKVFAAHPKMYDEYLAGA